MENFLENANWDRLKRDVNTRIDTIKLLLENMAEGEEKQKIYNDLILPNLKLLAAFCCDVEIEDTDYSPSPKSFSPRSLDEVFMDSFFARVDSGELIFQLASDETDDEK